MCMKKFIFLFLLCCSQLLNITLVQAENMPQGFVYLSDVDSSIIQEMRYAGDHNFIGAPVLGYEAPECILTYKAAKQLKKIQKKIKPLGYTLKVYECYRPQEAVNFFITWSKNSNDKMKAEFYPRVNKKDVFKLGYVAAKSGHTRGSTVDLTIVKLPVKKQEKYDPKSPLVACYAPLNKRFKDNSIDMGTGYDCLDEISHPDNADISFQAYSNRMFLRYWMYHYGFYASWTEWWHFTLKDEPYPDTYFNFAVG